MGKAEPLPFLVPANERSVVSFIRFGSTRWVEASVDAQKGKVMKQSGQVSEQKLSVIVKLRKIEGVKDGGHAVRDARVSTLVDSMRASSPARARPASVMNRAASLDDEQKSWILHHPSALSAFEKITAASMGKKIVMFLDYDGTLSPIVDDPDRAFMSGKMRAAVKDTARFFPTAIVSGRCRDKVFSFVKLTELYYAGSHGMDIRGPPRSCSNGNKDGESVLCQPASEFLPMIDKVYKTLSKSTKSFPGARVETNKFCLSVHFRCVDEKSWDALAEQVKLVVSGYPKLKLTSGRKVLEIRPTIEWDKGKALEFLLEALGFANPDDKVLPIYIGDDRTDEDAFKVLKRRGQGIGILVSKVPKETSATYSLREPSEVMSFLRHLTKWKQKLSRAA